MCFHANPVILISWLSCRKGESATGAEVPSKPWRPGAGGAAAIMQGGEEVVKGGDGVSRREI